MAAEAQAKKEFELWCANVEASTPVDLLEEPVRMRGRIKRLLDNPNEFVHHYFPHYSTDEATGKLIDCAGFQEEFLIELLKDPNYFGANEWPREHAKSVFACVIAPLWLLAHGELKGMILASATDIAAKKLLSDLQAELEFNQRLVHDFGQQKNLGSWEAGEYTTKDGIMFKAFGRGQSPRGTRHKQFRPNYGVADDIDDDEIVLNQKRVRKAVEWLLGAFYGAMTIKASRFVICGNRIHRQSILAHVVGDITPQTPKRTGLRHSKILAYDAEGKCAWWQRYTREEIDRKMARMGSILGRREFFHEPAIIGTVFKDSWIIWGKIPPLKEMEGLVMYCDPSFKGNATSDFKAIVLVGKKAGTYYVIKSFCRQTTVTAMVKWWYDFAEKLPENVAVYNYIEGIFAQDEFLKDFKREGEIRGWQLAIRADKRDKPDKYARIVANMQPLYENGLVIYNQDEESNPDMQEGKGQLLAIEPGSATPDDWPDAKEGAIFKLNRLVASTQFDPVVERYENQNAF